MLVLPTIIITLSSISGASGIALSVKSIVDSMNASSTNRLTQEQNEKNLLRLEAVSEKLDSVLNKLGETRLVITKNLSVFIDSFEKIHNRPEFTNEEDTGFPKFDFNEIKNVSIIADTLIGATVGAISGSALAAAAASGTTAAVMALGTASTGTKIAELYGAAATKAALAALGGGSLAANGGGIALGTLVLNAASFGVGILVEGIAMAYAGSVARKQADKAKYEMLNNEQIINDAIYMQNQIRKSAVDMKKISVELCNHVYKPLVMKMQELIAIKSDWNSFSSEERLLVENNILIVQILHNLNNTPLYKVTQYNSKGEVEEVISNTDEVQSSINNAQFEAAKIGDYNGK